MCFCHLFTQKLHFVCLKTEIFENTFQHSSFWKKYHYHPCVNYKNVDFCNQWRHAHDVSQVQFIVMCTSVKCFFQKWHRQPLSWPVWYSRFCGAVLIFFCFCFDNFEHKTVQLKCLSFIVYCSKIESMYHRKIYFVFVLLRIFDK